MSEKIFSLTFYRTEKGVSCHSGNDFHMTVEETGHVKEMLCEFLHWIDTAYTIKSEDEKYK